MLHPVIEQKQNEIKILKEKNNKTEGKKRIIRMSCFHGARFASTISLYHNQIRQISLRSRNKRQRWNGFRQKMRWTRLNFQKNAIDSACYWCCWCWEGVAKFVVVIVAGVSELHGNDTIDQVATNWTKPTRIPDDKLCFSSLYYVCLTWMCVWLWIFVYTVFSIHFRYVTALFTLLYSQFLSFILLLN